jgi:hypothetical protein
MLHSLRPLHTTFAACLYVCMVCQLLLAAGEPQPIAEGRYATYSRDGLRTVAHLAQISGLYRERYADQMQQLSLEVNFAYGLLERDFTKACNERYSWPIRELLTTCTALTL